MAEDKYDLLVIGSGPAGQRAAIQAAKLGKKVAVIEKRGVVGGMCINLGTIPSKTLREAVLYLSGYRQRSIYGASYSVKEKITMEDLLLRTEYVIRHEIDVINFQLKRNNVELINAAAGFVDPHTIAAEPVDGRGQRKLNADIIVIATGTTATQDPKIPFDGQHIFTSDDILELKRVPKTLTVVGAGVIGCEYASIFAALGVRVDLIDKRSRLLPFADHEITDTLAYFLRQNRMSIHLGEEVSNLEPWGEDQVKISLSSGKQIITQAALYSIARTGNTTGLNLQRAGLQQDERGRIEVNEFYQTQVPHIYAVGDVIGFPSLASTSMEQGRIASCHAFGHAFNTMPEFFPYGIYTIPEISMAGQTEEELTREAIPYQLGRASYREIARGQIIGDEIGLLKLLFHLKTHEILGVHIIGEGASELVHIGQAVMVHRGKIEYFIDTVFNYPTLAECYKTAAFDGMNRL
jgi:NAD(P) transhydrogenase